MQKCYFIDSSSLIQAKNDLYAFDIAPGFWKGLESSFASERVLVCRLVFDELMEGDDELSEWIHRFKDQRCIIEPDETIQVAFQKIADYVIGKYPRHQADHFLSGADPWIIAQASVMGGIVVTQEGLDPEESRKVKIPNVCEAFKIPWISLAQMMRDLEIRLR